ncbi:hypothetical protein pb186bvf_019615 [Paramecium bursaria]
MRNYLVDEMVEIREEMQGLNSKLLNSRKTSPKAQIDEPIRKLCYKLIKLKDYSFDDYFVSELYFLDLLERQQYKSLFETCLEYLVHLLSQNNLKFDKSSHHETTNREEKKVSIYQDPKEGRIEISQYLQKKEFRNSQPEVIEKFIQTPVKKEKQPQINMDKLTRLIRDVVTPLKKQIKDHSRFYSKQLSQNSKSSQTFDIQHILQTQQTNQSQKTHQSYQTPQKYNSILSSIQMDRFEDIGSSPKFRSSMENPDQLDQLDGHISFEASIPNNNNSGGLSAGRSQQTSDAPQSKKSSTRKIMNKIMQSEKINHRLPRKDIPKMMLSVDYVTKKRKTPDREKTRPWDIITNINLYQLKQSNETQFILKETNEDVEVKSEMDTSSDEEKLFTNYLSEKPIYKQVYDDLFHTLLQQGPPNTDLELEQMQLIAEMQAKVVVFEYEALSLKRMNSDLKSRQVRQQNQIDQLQKEKEYMDQVKISYDRKFHKLDEKRKILDATSKTIKQLATQKVEDLMDSAMKRVNNTVKINEQVQVLNDKGKLSKQASLKRGSTMIAKVTPQNSFKMKPKK